MPQNLVARAEVYRAIDGERYYQDGCWNPDTTPSGGIHPVGAWLTFMRSYLRQAEEQISRGADPQASDAALHTIRKIVAMGVACMEQNGIRYRELPGV
jgi:hypothetical protein